MGTSNTMSVEELITASKMKNTSSVTRLLKAKVDLNGIDEDGRTALHNAAEKGLDKTIKILLKGGADPTILDGIGDTAIAIATSNGHEKVADMLEAGISALSPGGTPAMAPAEAAGGAAIDSEDVL